MKKTEDILMDANPETFKKLKMTNPNRKACQDREFHKLNGNGIRLSNALKKYGFKKYQFKKQFSKKLKEASRKHGDERIMNYLEKFHNVSLASYDSRDSSIMHDFTCIAYLYEREGLKYAMDIQTGISYRVVGGTGFALTCEEYNYVESGNTIAYDMGNINYELYQRYNDSYDAVAKSVIKYDITTLNDIIEDIKQFIVVTNGFQDLDSEYVQSNLGALSKQKIKK